MRTDHERIIARIEEGEAKLAKQQANEKVLRSKIASYRAPLQQIKLTYNQAKGKSYSEDEDRFLLVQLAKYGLGGDDVYERIKKDVTEWAGFRFDWFIKSRTPQEIGRRCNTLLLLVLKEMEEEQEAKPTNGKTVPKVSPVSNERERSILPGRFAHPFRLLFRFSIPVPCHTETRSRRTHERRRFLTRLDAPNDRRREKPEEEEVVPVGAGVGVPAVCVAVGVDG